jgi:hypothetical protein
VPPEVIELETPTGRSWRAVVRLVLGGVGARAELGFEQLDDLQLAVERLLACAEAQESVKLSVELTGGSVRARVGPLREQAIAEALQRPDPPPGELTLRRVLQTVVDSFGVEDAADGAIVVRLEKLTRPA